MRVDKEEDLKMKNTLKMKTTSKIKKTSRMKTTSKMRTTSRMKSPSKMKTASKTKTNIKDDIFMQRQLVQNFTYIMEWGQGTYTLTKHTRRWTYSTLRQLGQGDKTGTYT